MTTDTTFDRLRAANPSSSATAVDVDALFDRVTRAAPDRRLRGPARRFRRPVVVLAVALAVVAVLASTALALSSWIGDIVGPSEVNSEFAKAGKRLSLPPGYAWPRFDFPADSVAGRGAGGAFAVGIAQSAWECYWVRAIGERDAGAERRARAALTDLMANHIVIAPDGASENWSPPQTAAAPTLAYADDGGYQYKEKAYAEAAAGKPQLLQQSCRANAPPGWRS
jgi:hypothetical protein